MLVDNKILPVLVIHDQKKAIDLVLVQAEQFSEEWSVN